MFSKNYLQFESAEKYIGCKQSSNLHNTHKLKGECALDQQNSESFHSEHAAGCDDKWKKELVFEEFKQNINDKSRNRSYTKFVSDIRDGTKHILALTDDLIVDLNMKVSKIDILNPTRDEYRGMCALVSQGDDCTKDLTEMQMITFKETLPNIVKVQVMKCDDAHM